MTYETFPTEEQVRRGVEAAWRSMHLDPSGAGPAPNSLDNAILWRQVRAVLASRPADPDADVPELVYFFRHVEPEWGNRGDREGWSPGRTAMEFIQFLQRRPVPVPADGKTMVPAPYPFLGRGWVHVEGVLARQDMAKVSWYEMAAICEGLLAREALLLAGRPPEPLVGGPGPAVPASQYYEALLAAGCVQMPTGADPEQAQVYDVTTPEGLIGLIVECAERLAVHRRAAS